MAGDTPIAVVGMGLRFPGAADPEALWALLETGADLVGPAPAARTARTPDLAGTDAAFLDDPARFDAPFFGMKGLEACTTDPAQRLLLEVVWEACENGCMDPARLRGTDTGVFVGSHTDDYMELAVRAGTAVNAYWNAGLNGSILANRISYHFDLHGPSLTLNTACSSSLEALSWAVTALRGGRCGHAVVGAANLILTPTVGLGAQRAGMLSPTGRCKTFDAAADGFVRGEGVAALLLKPLPDAVRDGDRVQAVIRAVRTAHGGHAASLAAPNLKQQRDLLVATYREADLDIADVGYMETHGTGTRLGDSVEIEALKEAWTVLTDGAAPDGRRCGLGSLKTNMGHLEAASGLAGVIKMVLAVSAGVMPPLVHFQTLSPLIALDGTPFFPVTTPEAWPRTAGAPRRAGVSGFGFGGSYAHVVLEEAPQRPAVAAQSAAGPHVLVLSARDGERLRVAAERLARFLAQAADRVTAASVTRTLCLGRAAMPVRLAVVAPSLAEAAAMLHRYAATGEAGAGLHVGQAPRRVPRDPMPAAAADDPAAAARAWTLGYPVDWAAHTLAAPWVSLPTYPFAANTYWLSDTPG